MLIPLWIYTLLCGGVSYLKIEIKNMKVSISNVEKF